MLRRFLADRRGNFGIIFGLVLVPVVGLSGAGADFMMASAVRSQLQDVVDATALALSKENLDITASSLTTKADQLVRATFSSSAGRVVTAGATLNGNLLAVTATAELTPAFLPLFGIDKIETSVRSEVVWADQTLEVALVLDNTGSMAAGDRMPALKTAATDMVNLLASRITDTNQLKVAVVPFSGFVNVGPEYRTASWIDGAAQSPIHSTYFSSPLNRFTIYDTLGKTWPGCVETRPSPHDVADTAPSAADPATLFVPSFHPDEPSSSQYWSYPNSYMADQVTGGDWTRTVNAPKYTNPTSLNFTNSTFFSNYHRPRGPDFFCDIKPIKALTTDFAAVKTLISQMVPFGSTNIPEGIMWGWRVLSPGAPFTEGRAYDTPRNRKIIVLFTDGANSLGTTSSPLGGYYSSWGYPVSQRLGPNPGTNLRAGLDAKTRAACEAIKAKGIRIYTIGLALEDDAARTLLRDCASSPSNFYDTPTTSQLSGIFNDIANQISALRIAK